MTGKPRSREPRLRTTDPGFVNAFRSHVGATRVVCLGLSALDEIWRVDTFFRGAGEKIRAADHTSLGGGMAATAAVAVARLGGRAAFWGRAGADIAGQEMRRLLAADDVDVGAFKLFEGGRSSVSGILVDADGERQIVNFRGTSPDDPTWLPVAEVAGADCVLADPRWPAGARSLFAAARAAGVPTVLDADVADASVFDQLLPLTDHAIFSTPALAAIAGALDGSALEKVAASGCCVAAVTRGSNGVTWRADGADYDLPAFPVEAVDTTGAGDVFHGAYALGIGAGCDTAAAMAFASAAAALKCRRPGGRAGIPTLDETLALQGHEP